jgi:hypothetical protein
MGGRLLLLPRNRNRARVPTGVRQVHEHFGWFSLPCRLFLQTLMRNARTESGDCMRVVRGVCSVIAMTNVHLQALEATR